MLLHRFAGLVGAITVAWLVQQPLARAQEPSAAAAALGREVVELKGGIAMFDAVIEGVLRAHASTLLQVNPNLDADLNAILAQVRVDYAKRTAEIHNEIGKAYASQFSEAELRQVLAFYKTPLGKKLIESEPKAIDEAAKRVDAWSAKFADEVMQRMRAELRKKGHAL